MKKFLLALGMFLCVNVNVLVAALLYDTLEDTNTTTEAIETAFGECVRYTVDESEDISFNTIIEVDYDSDDGFNPMTVFILNDGTTWEVHPHYQYGMGPHKDMQIGIIPMTPDEIPDFTWLQAHPFWLVMAYKQPNETRIPVRRF